MCAANVLLLVLSQSTTLMFKSSIRGGFPHYDQSALWICQHWWCTSVHGNHRDFQLNIEVFEDKQCERFRDSYRDLRLPPPSRCECHLLPRLRAQIPLAIRLNTGATIWETLLKGASFFKRSPFGPASEQVTGLSDLKLAKGPL